MHYRDGSDYLLSIAHLFEAMCQVARKCRIKNHVTWCAQEKLLVLELRIYTIFSGGAAAYLLYQFLIFCARMITKIAATLL